MKKIIIVTGASSGMGVSFAQQLAYESACFKEKGLLLSHAGESSGSSRHVSPKAQRLLDASADEVWLVARRKDKLEETSATILKAGTSFEKESIAVKKGYGANLYPTPRIIECDISGKEGALRVQTLLTQEATVCKESGFCVTVLVNNAGFGTYGEFAKTDTVREMDMVDLDCTALTGITGFVLPYMKSGARLINTASLASYLPLGNFAVYGACKAYVLSLTVALAAELKARGIKVTALCPGPVSTEFANVASKGAREKVRHGLSPEKTVANCLRCSRKGKLYSMYAFKWKFKAFMSRFIGRYTGAWFTYTFCKRPSN
jgi:short-subunit dehydrogenase